MNRIKAALQTVKLWPDQIAWSDYTFLFNVWIARISIAVPLVGYLILFNDTVSSYISFQNIAPEGAQRLRLDLVDRLRFIYLDLIALAVANAVYFLRRPDVMQLGENVFEYVSNAYQQYILHNYQYITAKKRF